MQQKEALSAVGKMVDLQGKTLSDLQRESMRIEETISVAQKRVHFQRIQAQTVIAENVEAIELKAKEDKEREHLRLTQDMTSSDRTHRKGFKNNIIMAMSLLKEKQTEIAHLREAEEAVIATRVVLQQKRNAFQGTARSLEERERLERSELEESHDRAAKNLVVWQSLDMMHLDTEGQETNRRLNKVKAQQLKELQQKEAEQLREIQHLKAKFALALFDLELETLEIHEQKKADHLVLRLKNERVIKKRKQEAKRKIKTLKEQSRGVNDLEINALKGRQLGDIQLRRSNDLRTQQKNRAKNLASAFESELRARADDFDVMIDSEDFNVASASGGSGTGSQGPHSSRKSAGSASKSSKPSTISEQLSNEEVELKASDNRREKEQMNADEEETRMKAVQHKQIAEAALTEANKHLTALSLSSEEETKKLVRDQQKEWETLQDESEERRAAMQRANEVEMRGLYQTQAKEKEDLQASQLRELEAMQTSINLEKELHGRTLTETQVASQAKSEFLSFVCHELRNPLSGIVAIVDMLLNSQARGAQSLDSDLLHHVQTIKQESELMCAIVNDVLDFSKIEANMLVLDPVDFNLRQTVNELVKEQQLIATKTRPDITVNASIGADVPEFVTADPVRMRQVMLNLISNAVKFTFTGTVSILVQVESKTNEGWVIKFEVQDTGVGIAQGDLEHIFSAFSQAKPSTTREFGGTGLGLSICKALVERLGGSIGVSSELGKGTCFSFTIMVKIAQPKTGPAGGAAGAGGSGEAAGGAASAGAAAGGGSRRSHGGAAPGSVSDPFPSDLKVLCVEDSATLRRLWAKLLTEQGCTVETAKNGQEALNQCADNLYDVVLMDITMPVMSGDTAVAKLRQAGWEGVVVALTANALETDREKYLKAGMDAVVTKPFQMDDLRAMINTQLQKRGRITQRK